MKILLIIKIIVFSFYLVCSHIYAVSFDCGKAVKAADITVCSSRELSKLDDINAEEYKKAKLINEDLAKQYALNAYKEKMKCAHDSLCIKKVYKNSIKEFIKIKNSKNKLTDLPINELQLEKEKEIQNKESQNETDGKLEKNSDKTSSELNLNDEVISYIKLIIIKLENLLDKIKEQF